jgi:hypothetical protein
MDELVPVPALSAEVVRFSATHFRPTMIGVHLRRGDFIRARPDLAGNTQTALNHVRSLLATELDAGILVCTDDGAPDPWTRKVTHEGVLSTFQRALGDRVVSRPPRSLDRSSPAAIQDALVDLLLLRKTNMFVGTQSSTFSELAIYGRDVTSVWCGAPRQEYVRLERLARLTGIYFVLQGAGWLRYGHRLPLHTLLRRFFLAPLGRIKRAVWRT